MYPSSKHCLNIKISAALLSTFNCCGLSANLYIPWLKTQAMVYELVYFDTVFKGADKRVWQLLENLKNDEELHYVTIKSKTLICHFYQNTPVRPFIHPFIFAGYEMTKMGTKWPKGYEMSWGRIDHHIVISYPVDLGTKWPIWVRNDLGTKRLLLGTKWPKSRYEMTNVGTKWPRYEMTGNPQDINIMWYFYRGGT